MPLPLLQKGQADCLEVLRRAVTRDSAGNPSGALGRALDILGESK